ncbi:hypothetical protein RV02_GL002263 [Enterococcus gilvus]|nr:hypothetical protein RV02_GL002263 [Enterococcus gilvus]
MILYKSILSLCNKSEDNSRLGIEDEVKEEFELFLKQAVEKNFLF